MSTLYPQLLYAPVDSICYKQNLKSSSLLNRKLHDVVSTSCFELQGGETVGPKLLDWDNYPVFPLFKAGKLHQGICNMLIMEAAVSRGGMNIAKNSTTSLSI